MTSFQIDGSDVEDPIDFSYEERASPVVDAYGCMVVSAYRSAVATFNTRNPSDFNGWSSKADGTTARSIKCPAPDSTTYTTYSNVFIKYLGASISTGPYFYEASFRVWHLSTDSLPAFGA